MQNIHIHSAIIYYSKTSICHRKADISKTDPNKSPNELEEL